jgi:hypothetical protein
MSHLNNFTGELEPKIKAYKFKLGTIKKGKDKRYWKVVKAGTLKIWNRANRRETMCQNFLKQSINKSLKKYKKGDYKSAKQAVAVGYSLTKRKFPNCQLVTNPKKMKNK